MAAVRGRAPFAIAVAASSPNDAETRAARSTTSSSQPPARNPSARSTWASHCWSVHGVPATVNVYVSTAGISPVRRISSPARTW